MWRDPGTRWPAKLKALLVLLAFMTIAFAMFALNLIGYSVDI